MRGYRTTTSQRSFAVAVMCAAASVAMSASAALAQRGSAPPANASASATAAPADKADVSGKWAMIVAGPQGANEAFVNLRQEAESLSGTIDSQLLGAGKLSGTIRGDTLRFVVVIAIQGAPYEVRASASLRDKDNITGSLEPPNGVANFPFTMKRVP